MKKINKLLSILLAIVIAVGVIPTMSMTVFAAHRCPDCEDLIDGSPYCSECYKCDACVDLCIECGICTDCSGSEICGGCSDEEIGSNMCLECAYEKGTHCPSCDGCYFSVQQWCEECSMCADCVTIDEQCSITHGMIVCEDCAAEKDSHCPGCSQCYFEVGSWCEECMLCDDCSSIDKECSETHSAILCGECASERGSHCSECSQCYFDVGSWCEECGKCEDCSPACTYCCEEAGAVICEECAIESGMHCPECSGCYDGGEFCIECGVCTACADICSTDELCMDCAISNGYHCPGCEACGYSTVICEGCGEKCLDCSNVFCENCNLCDECVLICQGCGSCEECATICPNCEEYCSECEGICDDCELCLVCCADIAGFAGCDCGEWICVESDEWDEHFQQEHTTTDGSHNSRPSPTWEWDDTYHWHSCVYCDDTDHYTSKNKHTFDLTGKCTACYYVKDAKIQIIVQPKNSKIAFVNCPDETPDERNIAHFSVKAIGNSELTYTWCYIEYVGGQKTYVPLKYPGEYENYSGPNLDILVPEDACWSDYYLACIITDEEGNEVKTVDVCLTARHDYHYYKLWKTHIRPCELAQRNQYGHILQCVGTNCEKVTQMRPHEDEDKDGYCDICDYELGAILITKQPKDSKSAYVCSADETYDENNIAHFSVEAIADTALTYTWCRKQYINGELTYVPLKNPEPGENYTGPNLDLLVPTDACYVQYTYCCLITDQKGSETRTVDVTLKAKHNYQYFKDYLSTRENAYGGLLRLPTGHFLQCVGEGCEKSTKLRRHEESNNNFTCDICDYRSVIDLVELNITTPVEGQKPKYTVTCASTAYYADGTMNNGRYWFVSDNGVDNWKLIDNTHTFTAGKYYKFSVDLCTADGYRFDKYKTYNSKVLVKVNGGPGFFATKTYNKEYDHYITAEYVFGECNDSIIENIVIDGVTEPIAGQKPTYEAAVRGSGYYINSSKNAQLDDYWNTPQQKPHYIKNGVGWFDLTDYDWVYENETFIPGHEYQINVYIKTEDGYTFWHDKWNDMLFSASVNGTGAEGNTTTSLGLTEQTIRASFICQPQEISTIMIYNLDAPQAGKTPDYNVTAAYPELYQPDPNYAGTNGVIWYDSEGTMLDPTDKFVDGEIYKVEIKVIPSQINSANVCKFVSPVAYIDGKQVIANGDWDMVYGNSNAVYIYYTFTKGASAPSVIYGDANDDGNINARDYAMIIQHINGWAVTIDTDAADANGDGNINARDYAMIIQYLNGWPVTLGPQA